MRDSDIVAYRVDVQGNPINTTRAPKKTVTEYIPAVKTSALKELNRRRLALPAATVLFEAMRRYKTKQRPLTLSASQLASMGLTRKQGRLAIEALQAKAEDIVKVCRSGNKASIVTITPAGWKMLSIESTA